MARKSRYNLTSKEIKNIERPNLRMTWEGATFERTEDELEFLCDREALFGSQPAQDDVYRPNSKQRIPKEGAWAMIIRKLPGIEGGIDKHFRVGRIFYMEHERSADQFGFMPDGRYKVLCNSPWGTLHLWPYEYSVIPVPTILPLWQDGELVFHPTNVQLTRFNDIVHYSRSRGISLADAMVMALGTLKGPVGWFEPRTDLAVECEAMEQAVHNRVHLTVLSRWMPRRRNERS